jgi:hypothetical protein
VVKLRPRRVRGYHPSGTMARPPQVGDRTVTSVGTYRFRVPTTMPVSPASAKHDPVDRSTRDRAVAWIEEHVGGRPIRWEIARYRGPDRTWCAVFFFDDQRHRDAFRAAFPEAVVDEVTAAQ